MSDEPQEPLNQDPPIFKHLNAKTRGLLRQTQKAIAEQTQSEAMSANEQT